MKKLITFLGTGFLLACALFCGTVLSAPNTHADSAGTVDVNVIVPVACSLSPENTYLENTIYPGTSGTIGTAKIKAVCNDPSGFAIYAVGFTGDNYGDNNLRMIENGSLSQTYIIQTGTATTGDTSGWNMSIAKDNSVSGNYEAIIENGFDMNNNVPSTFTKIASLNSTTDQIIGSNLLARFDAYIAPAQAAGSYEGKVKFTLVHPSANPNPGGMIYYDANGGINAPDPQAGEEGSETGTYNYTISSQIPYKFESVFLGWAESPDATEPQYQPEQFITISKPMTLYAVWREAQVTMLDTGSTINAKLKNMANGIDDADRNTVDTKIKAFLQTDSLPSGFIATTENTISSNSSTIPIYVFFDNTNEQGVMYYYTEADIVYANSNSSNMFRNINSLADITGLANWDTTTMRSMEYMFLGTKISNVDALATGKNGNPNIWNMGNVTNMYALFSNATSLVDISGLANWDTVNVNNMGGGMFYGTKITNVDALATGKNGNPNIWNTGNVTNMFSMFCNASFLTDISGLANWDTAKVTNMSSMFSNTKITNTNALATGKNGNPNIWNTGNVTTMVNMFSNASYLTDVSGLENWNTAKVVSFNWMFNNTKITNTDALATGKNGNPNIWNTGNATDMSSMFAGATTLTDISGLANWDTAKVIYMGALFRGTQIVNVNALATGKNGNPNIWNTGNVKYMHSMFAGVTTLTDISGLANWDTAQVIDMNSMFYQTKITSADALATSKNSNPNIWNTGNVKYMHSMFAGVTTLTDISGLANWDTVKVTDMNNMFNNTKIKNVDALSSGKNGNPNIWNTGSVTNMSGMFSSSLLNNISGLANWDTANVTNMSYMFYGIQITNVDALATGKNGNPNIWNTANVTNMKHMFYSATSLSDISGLANWDTAKVTDMSNMFVMIRITNVDALATGKNGNPNIWNTSSVTNMSGMFANDSSLMNIAGITGWNVSNVIVLAGDTTESTNYFYHIFIGVPSSAISSFSFTNRPGSVVDGTYVPGTAPTNGTDNNTSPSSMSGNTTPMSYHNPSNTGRSLAMQYYGSQALSESEQSESDEPINKKDETDNTKSETGKTAPLGVNKSNEANNPKEEKQPDSSNVYSTVAIAGAGLAAVTGAVILLGKKRNKNEEEQ